MSERIRLSDKRPEGFHYVTVIMPFTTAALDKQADFIYLNKTADFFFLMTLNVLMKSEISH